MNRFRLRQLETVLGRGPRGELCAGCGGLDMEMVFGAMEVQDGETGDLEQANLIIDELDEQPRTCMICGGLTSSGSLQEMSD